MSNEAKITDPLNMDSILLKASQEILSKNDRFCFSVDNDETVNEKTFYKPYDSSELAEFINFDLLGEDEENPKSTNHLINSKKYEDITKDGGVLKMVLDPGVGQVVPEDSIVLLHYIGYVSNFHEPFDVTYLQGRRPKSFRLGIGDLLLGLEVAILTMRYGENARIILSPKYAYREMGCPPRIPPNATIVFDVHLVSYYPSTNSRLCDEGENDLNKFQTNLKIVKKLHYEGNECFKTNKINKAVVKYEKAKELLHLTGCNNDQEEIEMFKYLDKLYSNLSICYLKICVFNKVCRMGSEAMRYSGKYSKNNVKLWFNWGKALRLLKDFTEGKKKLQRALKLEPENESIHYELQRLETDRTFHYRIKSLNTFKNNTVNDNNKRLPSEFWQVFDTIINEFVDGTDEILTVALNNNSDDIELAKCKVNLLDLQFQQNENVDSHCFTIKKKL